jgi:hypothetical protein
MAGALTLADYLGAMVRVACRKCDRCGQYRRSSLVALYGDKAPHPDVLRQLAHDCPKRGAIGNEACGVYFPDLAGRRRRSSRV